MPVVLHGLRLLLPLIGAVQLATPCQALPAVQAVEWTVDVDAGMERAAAEKRVVLLALGTVLEPRSDRHLKELYGAKELKPYLSRSVNLAAWMWFPGDQKRLPKLGEYTRHTHVDNLDVLKQRWLRPNSDGVIALPQHVWLSAEGEVLLSCPWEIDVQEFAWCFDEALRKAGVEDRPALMNGAHAPRRLLLGEVLKVGDDDELGRGLRPNELTVLLNQFKRGVLTDDDEGKGKGIRRLLCTDDKASAKYMQKELAFWDIARREQPSLEKILDGTINYLGLNATPLFFPVIEQFIKHERPSLRAEVAVAYEQIGDPGGLTAVKTALKKEKDDRVRGEWLRALGACGRGNASVSKILVRVAAKEKDAFVRASAILALGHVLPEPKADEFLHDLLQEGNGDDRRAALLALGLGRSLESREAVEALSTGDDDLDTREIASTVLEILDGANLISLRKSVMRIVPSEIERWRLFYWRGGQ